MKKLCKGCNVTTNPAFGIWPNLLDDSNDKYLPIIGGAEDGNLMRNSPNPEVRKLYKAMYNLVSVAIYINPYVNSTTGLIRLIKEEFIPEDLIQDVAKIKDNILKRYTPNDLYEIIMLYK